MDRTTRRRVLATGACSLAGLVAGCFGSTEGGGPVTEDGTPASDGGDGGTGGPTVTGSPPPGTTVEMGNGLRYDPERVRIEPGETVVWPNTGTATHSVTAYGEGIPDGATYFASGGFAGESAAREAWPRGDVPPGEAYWHTFETPGTYRYFCIPHEANDMVGVVEVG